MVRTAVLSNVVGDTVGEWCYSIGKSWQVILVAIPVAVVLGYIYLFVIRLVGGFIIWFSFALIVTVLTVIGFYSWFYLRA